MLKGRSRGGGTGYACTPLNGPFRLSSTLSTLELVSCSQPHTWCGCKHCPCMRQCTLDILMVMHTNTRSPSISNHLKTTLYPPLSIIVYTYKPTFNLLGYGTSLLLACYCAPYFHYLANNLIDTPMPSLQSPILYTPTVMHNLDSVGWCLLCASY